MKALTTALTLALALGLSSVASAQERASTDLRSSAVRYVSGDSGHGSRAVRPSVARSRRSPAYSRYGRDHGVHSYGRQRGHRVWVPGCYVYETRPVWIPGSIERVWVDPVYGWSLDACGIRIRIVTQEGHWRTVERPGHYVERSVRVWRPGYWSYRS